MRSPTVLSRRAGTIEPVPYRPVLVFVGLAWSLVTLAVLGIMLLPLAYGAIDLILHH